MKKFVALLLATMMMLALLPTIAIAEEPTVIRWGTHWVNGLDPHFIDETTGAYSMTDEADRLLRVAAEEAVLAQHNVKIEYVQYAQDTRSELVLSVLAGNPVCDVALMWNGSENTVLAQNILQPLDAYVGIFEGADWMLPAPVYGHNYFINNNQSFNQYFTLLCNLTMIEQVEALKDENGNTIYPMDLLAQGKWTWSNFKDYLGKIAAHYANTPAPADAKVPHVAAYETDYRFGALSASYANGGAIYGANGLQVDSPETIEAVAYVKELLDLEYAMVCGLYDDGWVPQWCEAGYDFGRGACVFGDCPIWVIKGQVDACTARGESVAIMPWPANDRLVSVAEDGTVTYSPEYRQVISVGDVCGVLKGIPAEKVELALASYRTYWETYYSLKAGITDMAGYKAAVAQGEARNYGLDIYHEVYGQAILDAFIFNSELCVPNDFAGLLGMRDPWDAILGKGYQGIDGMPSYEVAIKANMADFTNKMTEMEAILGSTELNDNQAPSVSANGTALVALGADAAAIDWTQYFTAEDGFDGVMDPALAAYEVNVDTAVIGSYKVKATFTDNAGNSASAEVTAVVYNAENTTAPTLTVKAELPTIAQDTDMTTIDWAGAYVESAVDADGLDIKANVVADMSELDTSFPDFYYVILTVTDYAGNTAEVEIEVEVVAAE